ncbi:hypothetical protein [Streptomyces fagopyri]|uniref:hypothetical protein n=1 Tax=Streptomyces fagopyri TaxID=2662397 RepID=UPI0033F5981C
MAAGDRRRCKKVLGCVEGGCVFGDAPAVAAAAPESADAGSFGSLLVQKLGAGGSVITPSSASCMTRTAGFRNRAGP